MTNEEITYDEYFLRTYDSLIRYCLVHIKYDKPAAEDITIDAFTELYKKWEAFDYHTEAGLYVWMTRTIDFKIKAYNRKLWNTPATESYDEVEAFINFDDSNDSNDILFNDYIKLIKSKLSDDDWTIFEYRFIRQYNFDKIALLCGIQRNTAYVRWFRVRQQLKKLLK